MISTVLERLADKTLVVCQSQGWERGWQNLGCHLHLEVSEFIESLRGKGDEPPEDEAADVLFVFLSAVRSHGVSIDDVLRRLDKKCDDFLEGRRGVLMKGVTS